MDAGADPSGIVEQGTLDGTFPRFGTEAVDAPDAGQEMAGDAEDVIEVVGVAGEVKGE